MKIDKAAGWLSERAGSNRDENVHPFSKARRLSTLKKTFPSLRARGDRFVTISERLPFHLRFPEREEAKAALLSNLCLLYGIGSHYDRALREAGYESIPSLIFHPRFGKRAQERLNEWGSPIDPAAVYRTLSDWLPSSHPLFLRSLSFVKREGLLFFDLETLGLANAPIFLLATGRITEGSLAVNQHLAASLEGEASLLEEFERELEGISVLISYNGKAFDWPILRERSFYYGIPFPNEPIHIDLLHHSRRRYQKILPDLQLKTVEEYILNVDRGADLPSSLVPVYYTAYLETGNPEALLPIIVHNRQDIVSLALLLSTLLQESSDAG
ncbi:exonuclease [Candidatus Acetothermia bacterium]|nr:MAG: exonuclease [Candidatus Acetothermia bacterium]